MGKASIIKRAAVYDYLPLSSPQFKGILEDFIFTMNCTDPVPRKQAKHKVPRPERSLWPTVLAVEEKEVARSCPLLADQFSQTLAPVACDVCRQDATCRRIGSCVRYRCAFGSVDKP